MDMVFDAEVVADSRRGSNGIVGRRAHGAVREPESDADDFVPGVLKQLERHGAVEPARESDGDFTGLLHVVHILNSSVTVRGYDQS
jgi:hypothetical protein